MQFHGQLDLLREWIRSAPCCRKHSKALSDDVGEEHRIAAYEEVIVGGEERLYAAATIAARVPGERHP